MRISSLIAIDQIETSIKKKKKSCNLHLKLVFPEISGVVLVELEGFCF